MDCHLHTRVILPQVTLGSLPETLSLATGASSRLQFLVLSYHPSTSTWLDAHKKTNNVLWGPEAESGDYMEIEEIAEIPATHHPGTTGEKPKAVFICRALTTCQRHTGHL